MGKKYFSVLSHYAWVLVAILYTTAFAVTQSPSSTPGPSVKEKITGYDFSIIDLPLLHSQMEALFHGNFNQVYASSFNQYGPADLNSFVINGGITTKVDFWNWPYCFSKWRSMARKQRVLHTYLEREHLIHEWVGRVLTSHPLHWNTHSQACTISTEGMASLYHPPASALVTTAPHTRRVESKKMGAPAGLPIYAEEDVLGRFK